MNKINKVNKKYLFTYIKIRMNDPHLKFILMEHV